MYTLRSFAITTMLIPFLLFGNSEESTLKEARIDVRVAQYHLAAVRLERLLKEYPKSHNRPEILTLIVKSYVMSKRDEDALPHLRALIQEFPREAATLDPKILELLPPSERPEKIVPVVAASPKPPEASVVVAAVAPPVIKKQPPAEVAPVVAAVTPPPPEPVPATGTQQEPDDGKAVPTPSAAVPPAPETQTMPSIVAKDITVADSTTVGKEEPTSPKQATTTTPPNNTDVTAGTAPIDQEVQDFADIPAKFELIPPSPDLAKSDLKFGMYNLAAERLERLLKEFPTSKYREEALNLLVSAYVMSNREEKALPHLRTLLHEYPGAVANLEQKTLELLSALPPGSVPAAVAIAAHNRLSGMTDGSTAPLPAKQPAADSPPSPTVVAATPPPNDTAPKATPAVAPTGRDQSIPAATSPQPPADKPENPQKDLPGGEPAPVASNSRPTSGETEVSAPSPGPDTAASDVKPVPPQQHDSATSAVVPTTRDHFTLFVGETLYRHTLAQKIKQLRTVGLRPHVRKNARTIEMYRLVAERFPTSKAAHKRLRHLARICKGAFVFKEGDTFCTAAGSFSVKELAEQEQKRLAGMGLTIKVVPVNAVLPSWRITAGKFSNRQKAEQTRKKILKIAAETSILRI